MHTPKPHREFFRVPLHAPALDDVRWQAVPVGRGAIVELILADNLAPASRTGSRTRLARWAPGTLLPTPVRHDFHEEVFLLSGDLVVGCDAEGFGGAPFEAYTFACRPPGVWHGPFVSRTGCVMLEFQYFA